MTRPRLGKSSIFGAITAVALALATFTAGVPATAAGAFTDCTPNLVRVSSGQLVVQCNSTNFIATTSPPAGCAATAVDVDTLKIWLTTSQSAVTNQKAIRIYDTACAGQQFINALDGNK